MAEEEDSVVEVVVVVDVDTVALSLLALLLDFGVTVKLLLLGVYT